MDFIAIHRIARRARAGLVGTDAAAGRLCRAGGPGRHPGCSTSVPPSKRPICRSHINRRGRHTAEALPEIITRLRRRGFEFVTVSELMNLTPPVPLAPPSTTAQAAPAAQPDAAPSGASSDTAPTQ